MQNELGLTLIQAELDWEKPEANRNFFQSRIATLDDSTEVVILPEMFTSGFTMEPANLDLAEGEKTRAWMLRMASASGKLLIGSTVFSEKGKHYNRLYAAYPNGDCFSYDKKHTFTLAGEDQVYESGKERLEIEYKGFRICPLICYDLRFPVWSRNTTDYDLLIYVANWPSPRTAAWDTLLKARAIENMAYVAGVNRVGTDGAGLSYSGHSAVYDMLGEQLCLRGATPGDLHVIIRKDMLNDARAKFKFLQDRDRFTLES